jgi:hypothetical protein
MKFPTLTHNQVHLLRAIGEHEYQPSPQGPWVGWVSAVDDDAPTLHAKAKSHLERLGLVQLVRHERGAFRVALTELAEYWLLGLSEGTVPEPIHSIDTATIANKKAGLL